ncbi:hypothetical protein CAK95_24400 [Pseudorhodoplanes sinuspersici]|uniref:HK97 gp10 family phage protein n=2 Tax=Pseudorhodoplanes sinuspersici TaxID=1235591 RepID=A0A1W6ZX49_9HYPH|nr:hypothetical protein CAK95_24400 [Pseudorhodoplanes sinuspersici]
MLGLEGLKDLDRALSELSKATARNVLLRTLKEEGRPIADAGEANAPKLTGELAQSYAVGTKLTRRQKKASKKESMVEVYIGPTPHPKSVQTEFGNAHQAPEPHLRPAWDSNVGRVFDGIKKALAEQIEKARARLARKAAREAAKLKQG